MSDDLNTPAFESVLGGGGSPVDKFRAMGAALRSGERPNLVEVTNREVVGALFAMIRHYEARGESANAVPPPLHIKVAFAAGLPKTLGALLELFAPENDWQENCEFRAGLEKHLGMPPKGGMSILPTFIATTANPESMELAAAYFSGGPAALLGVVGVDDPSALASWPELGAPPSAAAVGRKDKKTPASQSPEPSAPKPPSEPTPPGRHGLYGAEERAAVEAAGGLRFGVCNRVQCCCGYDDDDPWELGTIVALWYTEEDMSNDGEPCPEGTWFAAYQVRLDVGALIYAPSDTDDCVMAAPDDDDGGPGVDPRDFGWGGKFHHDGEDLGGPGGGPTLEATLIALAAGEDGRGAGLSPDDRAAGSPTYHPDDFQPVTGPNAMPVETQKRIAEHIAMSGGPFWMKGKSGQRATGPQEVDPVGQPKTSYVPNTQMLVKAAGVCVAAYFVGQWVWAVGLAHDSE